MPAKQKKVEGKQDAPGLTGSALVGRLGQAEKERRSEAADRYRRLVIDVADDVEVDPDEASDVLAGVGKSAAQLNDDVEAALRRRKLQREAETLQPLRNEARAIQQQIEAAAVEFNEVMQSHREQVAALNDQVQGIQRKITAAERAERLLYENCPDAGLLGALADVRDRMSDIAQRFGEAQRMVQVVGNRETKLRAIIRTASSMEDLSRAEEDLRRLRADDVRQEFEDLKAERAAIEAEEREVRQQMVQA